MIAYMVVRAVEREIHDPDAITTFAEFYSAYEAVRTHTTGGQVK
jgi:hypothetical protein